MTHSKHIYARPAKIGSIDRLRVPREQENEVGIESAS